MTLWNDYICPWAYAARPLTAWLRAEGVAVRVRSFELHPEIPPEGHRVRPGGRLDRVFDHIADECAASGLEFSKPDRSPNTHRLLGMTELVAAHWPDSFDQVDVDLARLHWVTGGDLDDDEALDAILGGAGVDVGKLRDLEADGAGEDLLQASMAAAAEAEVTGTPAWRIGPMTITGLHPEPQFRRWAERLIERNPEVLERR